MRAPALTVKVACLILSCASLANGADSVRYLPAVCVSPS
jgi:hypothetical protein